MIEVPKYPLLKKPEAQDPVAKSISNPNAFAKPGTMASKGVRFRPLTAKRTPGRPRKHKPDPRNVHFF